MTEDDAIDIRSYGLKSVNSMTKYPSIPTYHVVDSINHKIVEGSFAAPVKFPEGPVVVTEKINGTNARIVFTCKDYLIGSREEFVYAKRDFIGDNRDGLIEALRPVADRIVKWRKEHFSGISRALGGDLKAAEKAVVVAYFEVYGGRINGHKQYTSSGEVGVRLFDVVVVEDADDMLKMEPERLAVWRDRGGQRFMKFEEQQAWARAMDIQVVPELLTDGDGLQISDLASDSLSETLEKLRHFCDRSHVILDQGAEGKPEGVVVRTSDRSVIAKLRIEDYERSLGLQRGKPRMAR